MKYFSLIWMGLWRKRVRTVFTLLSIAAAFLLFGLLQGVDSIIRGTIAGANVDRLIITSEVLANDGGIGFEPLPIAHFAQIKSLPGVKHAMYMTQFFSYYQDPKNFIFSLAVEPADYLRMFPENQVSPEHLQAVINKRTGILVGEDAAKRYGWKIGDRIPLNSLSWKQLDGRSDWTFEVMGMIRTTPGPSELLLLNHQYVEEGRSSSKGTVTRIVAQVEDPADAGPIAKAIDQMFVNSGNETYTRNELAEAQSFLKQVGDIGFILHSVLGAVFATLLFLTVNTMMQSVRERIPEIAVLKTIGFSNGIVLTLVMIETLSICLIGGLVGLAMASMAFPLLENLVGVGYMPPIVIVWGALAAIAVAAVAGFLPAWRAKSLNIVDALARR